MEKYFIYFYVGFIILISSCNSIKKSVTNDKKFIPIKIEMNKGELDLFGLPVVFSSTSPLFYCLEKNVIFKDTIRNTGILSLLLKKNFIDFEFKNENKKITGQFFIPDFREIEYEKSYDPETMMVSGLEPFEVHNVIRTGLWVFSEGKSEKKRSYLSNLDGLSINKYCK